MRPWLVRSRAWLAIVILSPFAYVTLSTIPHVREDSPLDFALDAVAWSLFVAGGAFRWSATLYVGGKKNEQLSTSGPYSVCRNPLYFGTLLLALSIAVFLHSLVFAIGLAVAACFYLGVTIPFEEKNLRQIFGEEYVRYCQSVPRLLPRFRRCCSPPLIEVKLSGLIAESVRTSRWIWIPLFCEILAHLRAETWWPHFLHGC